MCTYRTRTIVSIIGLAAISWLTSCTSSGVQQSDAETVASVDNTSRSTPKPGSETSQIPNGEVAPTTVLTAGATPEQLGDANDIPRLENQVGALKDVSVKSCASDADRWLLRGTVTNPTADDVSYVIAVSFLDAAGTTRGLNWTKVGPLQPARTDAFEIAAGTAGSDLRCVLRVTRGR
jgi:hypothetical protein